MPGTGASHEHHDQLPDQNPITDPLDRQRAGFGARPLPHRRAGHEGHRIVGTWAAVSNVSGAACTPVSNVSALTSRVYLMYHAGGTITELPRLPGNTAPASRTFGVGTWHYDPDADTYYVSFRFDCYANGSLQG